MAIDRERRRVAQKLINNDWEFMTEIAADPTSFFQLGPDEICSAAERLSPKGAIDRATGRFLQLNAMENRVYDVELESGTRVITKFYRPARWTKEQILAEHKFLLRTFEQEIPVVPPLKDAAGDTLFDCKGIHFAVFPKQGGRLEPELNQEQLTRLGRFMARIHQVGKSLPSEPRIRLNPQTYIKDSLASLESLGFLNEPCGKTFKTLAAGISDLIEPQWQAVAAILLHGDCHGGNVLWRGDAPHFIDFDDMLYAPPVQDFWMLVGGSDDYALRNLAILITAYEEVEPFDYGTIRLIECLRAMRMIYFPAWIGRRWTDGAFKAAFPYFGSERYWQGQVEDLYQQKERVAGGSELTNVERFLQLKGSL